MASYAPSSFCAANLHRQAILTFHRSIARSWGKRILSAAAEIQQLLQLSLPNEKNFCRSRHSPDFICTVPCHVALCQQLDIQFPNNIATGNENICVKQMGRQEAHLDLAHVNKVLERELLVGLGIVRIGVEHD